MMDFSKKMKFLFLVLICVILLSTMNPEKMKCQPKVENEIELKMPLCHFSIPFLISL